MIYRQYQADTDYRLIMPDKIVEAAQKALADLRPVWGGGRCTNSCDLPHSGKDWGRCLHVS
jgi:hypothetical protein